MVEKKNNQVNYKENVISKRKLKEKSLRKDVNIYFI